MVAQLGTTYQTLSLSLESCSFSVTSCGFMAGHVSLATNKFGKSIIIEQDTDQHWRCHRSVAWNGVQSVAEGRGLTLFQILLVGKHQ